jgi:hypothetical protein
LALRTGVPPAALTRYARTAYIAAPFNAAHTTTTTP